MLHVAHKKDEARLRASGHKVLYAGRPSPLGNPYAVEDWGRGAAIAEHRKLFYLGTPEGERLRRRVAALEDGTYLLCWCRTAAENSYHGNPCHCDTYVEYYEKERGVAHAEQRINR